MPREPRIYIEKVLYLVTARGHEDHDLFLDHEDFSGYLKSLSDYKREYGFKLYAYAVLPKRLCLLIELQNDVTISTIMHNLNSKYTKNYNSRYGRKGHLFQSRFKSKLIEKQAFLTRMTRYIHLMPKADGITEDFSAYPYSSFSTYVDGHPMHSESESPELDQEILEVLNHLSENGSENEKRKAYDSYVRSADDQEFDIVQKLMHRTAYVGSKEFTTQMRQKVKDHVLEEENSKIVRKVNTGYVLAGSLVVLFLSVAAFNFYNGQSRLQQTLDVTASGMGAARDELARRITTLTIELNGYEQKENHGLGGLAWELQLYPMQQENNDQVINDKLHFKGGRVISASLMERGFMPFDYTISQESHGEKIWKTVQTNSNGTTVHWYGVINGDQMRGTLSEQPVSGKKRDFSFVSVRRTNDQRRAENVVQ